MINCESKLSYFKISLIAPPKKVGRSISGSGLVDTTTRTRQKPTSTGRFGSTSNKQHPRASNDPSRVVCEYKQFNYKQYNYQNKIKIIEKINNKKKKKRRHEQIQSQ